HHSILPQATVLSLSLQSLTASLPRRLRPLKMNMFRLKVVKRRHLPARMSKVKLMNQVHLLMEAQKGPVNTSVSEVKKQDHR
ncbi:unnamed protein product, partial [Brassica oleracea var. botrytis]